MATNQLPASLDVGEKLLTPETMPINAPIKLTQETLVTNLPPVSPDTGEKQLMQNTMLVNSPIKPEILRSKFCNLCFFSLTHTLAVKKIFLSLVLPLSPAIERSSIFLRLGTCWGGSIYELFYVRPAPFSCHQHPYPAPVF